MRHSLSDKSARAATVLGAWSDLPGAIPQEEIIGVFRDKSKRPKGLNSVPSSASIASTAVVTELLDVTEVT